MQHLHQPPPQVRVPDVGGGEAEGDEDHQVLHVALGQAGGALGLGDQNEDVRQRLDPRLLRRAPDGRRGPSVGLDGGWRGGNRLKPPLSIRSIKARRGPALSCDAAVKHAGQTHDQTLTNCRTPWAGLLQAAAAGAPPGGEGRACQPHHVCCHQPGGGGNLSTRLIRVPLPFRTTAAQGRNPSACRRKGTLGPPPQLICWHQENLPTPCTCRRTGCCPAARGSNSSAW